MEKWDETVDELKRSAEQASHLYHRLLVFVSGEVVKSGQDIAERLGLQRINVGEELGGKLLEVPARRRPLKVAGLLEDSVNAAGANGVVLDRIEILFEESLKAEPLTLLRNLSRKRLVIAMWSGKIEADSLVYGSPGHPEYRSYPARDLNLVHVP